MKIINKCINCHSEEITYEDFSNEKERFELDLCVNCDNKVITNFKSRKTKFNLKYNKD